MTAMLYIVLFVLLIPLGGWLIDGLSELLQIRRDKIQASMVRHPAGGKL